MKNQTVPYFVEPVASPQGEASKNGAPVLLTGFVIIDVNNNEEQGDDIPFKMRGIS